MASGDSQVFSVLKVVLALAAACAVRSPPATGASLDAGATLATVSFPELLPPTRVRRIHRYAVRFPVPRPYPVEKLVPFAVPHPIPVPIDAPFQVPVQHPVEYGVPHPIPVPFPHNIPIPVPHAVPVAVNHPYPVPIRKLEPYPVKHLIPYGVPRPFPVPHPVPVSVPNEALQVGEQLGNSLELEQTPGVTGYGRDVAPTAPAEFPQSLPVGVTAPQIQPTGQGYPLDQTQGVTGTAQQPLQYASGAVLVPIQQQPVLVPQNQQQVVAVPTGADISQQQNSNIPLQYALVGLIQQQLTAMQLSSNQSSIDTAPVDQGVTQPDAQPGSEEVTPLSTVLSDDPGLDNVSSNEEAPASESPVVQLQLVAVGTPQYHPVAVPVYHQVLQPAIPVPAPPLISNGSTDNIGPSPALNVSYYALPVENASSAEFPQQSDPHIPQPQALTPTQQDNQVQQSPEEYHQLLLSSFGDYNQQKGVTLEVASEPAQIATSETTPAGDEGVRSTTEGIQYPASINENLIADLQQRIFQSKHQQQIAEQVNFTQDQSLGLELLQKAKDEGKLYQKQLDLLQDTFTKYKQQLEQKFMEESFQQNSQGVSQHYQSAFGLFPLSVKLDSAQSTTTETSAELPATTSALLPTVTPVELPAESTSTTTTDVVTPITTPASLSVAPLSTSAPGAIITPETAIPTLAVSPTSTSVPTATTSSADVSVMSSTTTSEEAASVSSTVVEDAATPVTSTSAQTSSLEASSTEQPTVISTSTENPVSSTSEQPIQTREAPKQIVFAPVRFRQPVVDTVPTQVAAVQGQLGSIPASQPASNGIPHGGQQAVGLAVLVPYQQQSPPVHQEPQHQPLFAPYYQPQPQPFLPPFPEDGGHQWHIPV